MTTPLSIPQPDQPKPSPSNSSSTLPSLDPSQSKEEPSGPSQPIAGPSRQPQSRPSLPGLSLPSNSLNGFNGLAGVTGLNGISVNGTNGDAQSLQERLASAQQNMQGVQQSNLGGTNPDGTAITGTPQGATADALLKQVRRVPWDTRNLVANGQLHAMQASRIRQGQHMAMHQTQGNVSTPTSAQPNGTPSQSISLSNPTATPPQAPLSSSTSGTLLNSTGTGPSAVPAQLTQAQKDILTQQDRLRNSISGSSSNDSPSAPHTPTANSASTPTASNPARPPNPQASRAAIANQRQQFVQSLANYYRSNGIPPPQEVFNGERDGAIKVLGVWVDLVDLFMTVMRSQGVLNVSPNQSSMETCAHAIGHQATSRESHMDESHRWSRHTEPFPRTSPNTSSTQYTGKHSIGTNHQSGPIPRWSLCRLCQRL